MELEQSLPALKQRGLGLAALSYDSPAILKNFAERRQITFPLLSDPESKIIHEFGLLNESVPKGMFYGIPYPGTFVLDSKGVVIAKYFEDDYTQRFTASDILVKQFGPAVGAVAGVAHATVAAKHLNLSTSATAAVVHTGQRIALIADVELKPGIHVYAPGVQGYIPIDLAIADTPAGKSVKPGELAIEGTFRYQACDDEKCFIPETIRLKWTLRVEPHDSERAPVEIRHKQ